MEEINEFPLAPNDRLDFGLETRGKSGRQQAAKKTVTREGGCNEGDDINNSITYVAFVSLNRSLQSNGLLSGSGSRRSKITRESIATVCCPTEGVDTSERQATKGARHRKAGSISVEPQAKAIGCGGRREKKTEAEEEKGRRIMGNNRTRKLINTYGQQQKKQTNCLLAAKTIILLLIAHELYLQAIRITPLAASQSKCLPKLDFITTCSAAEILSSPPMTTMTISPSDDANTTTTTKTEFSPQETMREDTTLAAANYSETTTTTMRPPVAANVDNTINKHHGSTQQQQQQQHNVLCNSRCNCVILEPFAAGTSAASNGVGQRPVVSGGAHLAPPSERQSSGNSKINQQQTPKTTNEQQFKIEQSLVAFSEDYSQDYESATGSGGQEPELEFGQEPQPQVNNNLSSGPVTGSDRSGQRRRAGNDQSTGATLLLQQAERGAGANKSSSPPAGGSSTAQAIGNSTANTQLSHSNVTSAGGSKQQPAAANSQQQAPGMSLYPQLFGGGPQRALGQFPQARGSESSGPQLYAQSLYSSQAPKLSYHAHSPYLKSAPSVSGSGQQQLEGDGFLGQSAAGATPGAAHQHHHLRSTYLAHHLRQQQQQFRQQQSAGSGQQQQQIATSEYQQSIKRLVPLRTLDLAGKLAAAINATLASNSSFEQSAELVASVRRMVMDIGQLGAQSLVLRNNEIPFELWSELYALLASNFRQSVFHLDMSRNSLVKLGISFTGYIEHHLFVHGTWPVGGQQSNNGTTGSGGGRLQLMMTENGPKKMIGRGEGSSDSRLRHSLLSGGKLYTLVRQQLATIAQQPENGTGNISDNQISGSRYNNNSAFASILQQPMLLRALDLSHNKLRWLINDQFRALKHVQTIRLDHNRIRYINQHAFSGLESLRFLNLNFNRLQVIYIEQFQTNYNLLALMLSSNYIAYLRGGSFASLANLRRLDLSRNKLTIMSNNAFAGLESLELLNCSSNQFVHAPSASLHPLTSLRQLDLSDNLLAQLAPGTFFHLPIEELWLQQNEQLVAIDRGAFWDLPYLRRLHLSWNPMLMSVNSQAFVGTQSLQQIDVEGCQSLELSSRQMLENITMAATSRLLRHEQLRGQQQTHNPVVSSEQLIKTNSSSNPSSSSSTGAMASATTGNGSNQKLEQPPTPGASNQMKMRAAESQPMSRWLKYTYCFGILGLLAVALKLTFKLTPTHRYLEARRRRRRVYEAKSGACAGSSSLDLEVAECQQVATSADHHSGSHLSMRSYSSSDLTGSSGSSSMLDGRSRSSSVVAYPMCILRPDEHVIPALNGRRLNNDSYQVQQQQTDDHDINVINEQSGQPEASGLVQQRENDICVISDAIMALNNNSGCCSLQPEQQWALETEVEVHACCEPSILQQQQENGGETDVTGSGTGSTTNPMDEVTQQQQPPGNQQASAIDMIHSQLVAAGFDYGHANCAHFYQSLGPALQLADMTASFVNQMDYY